MIPFLLLVFSSRKDYFNPVKTNANIAAPRLILAWAKHIFANLDLARAVEHPNGDRRMVSRS
jgi:hypothetical protein